MNPILNIMATIMVLRMVSLVMVRKAVGPSPPVPQRIASHPGQLSQQPGKHQQQQQQQQQQRQRQSKKGNHEVVSVQQPNEVVSSASPGESGSWITPRRISLVIMIAVFLVVIMYALYMMECDSALVMGYDDEGEVEMLEDAKKKDDGKKEEQEEEVQKRPQSLLDRIRSFFSVSSRIPSSAVHVLEDDKSDSKAGGVKYEAAASASAPAASATSANVRTKEEFLKNAGVDSMTDEEKLALVKRIRSAGIVLVGNSRCVWTNRQRQLFGDKTEARMLLEKEVYHECKPGDKACEGVAGYPAWKSGNKVALGFRDLAGIIKLLDLKEAEDAAAAAATQPVKVPVIPEEDAKEQTQDGDEDEKDEKGEKEEEEAVVVDGARMQEVVAGVVEEYVSMMHEKHEEERAVGKRLDKLEATIKSFMQSMLASPNPKAEPKAQPKAQPKAKERKPSNSNATASEASAVVEATSDTTIQSMEEPVQETQEPTESAERIVVSDEQVMDSLADRLERISIEEEPATGTVESQETTSPTPAPARSTRTRSRRVEKLRGVEVLPTRTNIIPPNASAVTADGTVSGMYGPGNDNAVTSVTQAQAQAAMQAHVQRNLSANPEVRQVFEAEVARMNAPDGDPTSSSLHNAKLAWSRSIS